jgi:hypothetical protein
MWHGRMPVQSPPPLKHGPYYQLSYTRKGKGGSKFVKKDDVPTVRKQLKNYARMKLLMDRWIDLATELSTLRLIKEAD